MTAFRLNTELVNAGLVCTFAPKVGEVRCPDEDQIGFLDAVMLHLSGEFLVVQTGIGIECGYDESAYIYQWKDDRWQRYWESVQNAYTKDKYLPQHLQAVLISPTDYRPDGDKTAHVIVTLGTYPWCSSNWQPIYYRIWQSYAGRPPAPLLDGNEIGYISEPIQAAVWADDVLIEYAVGQRQRE